MLMQDNLLTHRVGCLLAQWQELDDNCQRRDFNVGARGDCLRKEWGAYWRSGKSQTTTASAETLMLEQEGIAKAKSGVPTDVVARVRQ